MRYAQVGDVSSLDGYIASAGSQDTTWLVYDRLTSYDLNVKPQPMLAESWDISTDFKQIKLNLRKNVQFHNGREFTSDDVKYNFQRVADPKVAAGGFVNQMKWFTAIETPDKYTVVLKSDQARPGIFDVFEAMNMIDKETLEGPNAKTTEVGTGPFKFVEWVQGDHLTFAKNPNYWQPGRPYFDTYQATILKDAASMVAQFEAGSFDVVLSPPVQDFARLKADSKYQALLQIATGRHYVIGANTLNAPLDNKVVRQALSYAIDRKRFATTVMRDVVQPNDLPWNEHSPAFEAAKQAQITFDLDKAKALLAQAGASSFSIDFLPAQSIRDEGSQFAQIYQSDLAKIGVTLNIKTLDAAAWLDAVNNRRYNGLNFAGASQANTEPLTNYSNSRAYDPLNNNEGFKSDKYTQLISAAAAEPDAAKRKALYSQLNDILLDESFVLPVATGGARILATAKVRDIGYTQHEGYNWTNAWLAA